MKQNGRIIKALVLVTQIGFSMMVPVFLCVFAGNFIDEKAGTGFFMPLFLLFGIGAAFRNVYYLLKPFYAKDKAREDAELAYIENLKKEGRQRAAERMTEESAQTGTKKQ
ncbi:MAG: AtpZ/AtpI family protein [Lachnospiraceae bacterium]